MAVHLATVADYLKRTTALLPASGDSTVSFWVKFPTLATIPDYKTAYAIMDNPAVYTDFSAIFQGAGAGSPEHFYYSDSSGTIATTNPTADTWYYATWTQTGTTQRFYVNGTSIGTHVLNRAAIVNGFEFLGNDTFSLGDVTIAYCREWTVALTQAQILVEMQATSAVHSANLWMDCPLTSNAVDISGNGHSWTSIGSPTFVASPSFPSNSSAATATAFSTLPQTITQDFGDGLYAWYSYTGVPSDLIVSFWPFASLSDTLTTTCSYGTSGSLTLFTQGVNVPMEVPTSNADTFFFKVVSSPGPPSTDVSIEGSLRPQQSVPVGSIGVNDDGNGDVNSLTLPAAFLGSSGETLAFAAAAAGETGMVFPPTGAICLYDALAHTVNIYPPTLGIATSTLLESAFHSGGPVKCINSDQTTQFYVGGFQSGTTCHAFTLSPDGVIGGTDYPITITAATNLQCMAPTQDNTILYYGDTGTATALRAWDLVNNVALSNLAAGVANHQNNEDLLVLADGSILAAYIKATAATDYFVRRYNAAGATLNTYNSFGASNRIHRMAHAIEDPDSFWVWLYLDDDPGADFGGGVSRFVQVDVATGAILTTIEATNFEVGVYNSEPVEDPIRFGHSFSCPFWIQREEVAPPIPPGVPVEYLIRRERSWPHLSSEQFRQFFAMLQIDLYAGNGITAGPVDAPVQGENPLLEIDWSDDGGHSWSNIHFVRTGKIGAYKTRAILRRMGYSRDRVYRIACSDPNQFVVIAGYLQAVLGVN